METTKVRASIRNLRITPRKVRLVSNVVRGVSVNTALAQLQMIRARGAEPIIKLLKSAVANAKNRNLNPERMVVESITVTSGPMLKRSLPRARGRATLIQKKSSHVNLVLAESNKAEGRKFMIYEKPKAVKTKKAESIKKPRFKEDAGLTRERQGFFQRMFRRKSI